MFSRQKQCQWLIDKGLRLARSLSNLGDHLNDETDLFSWVKTDQATVPGDKEHLPGIDAQWISGSAI